MTHWRFQSRRRWTRFQIPFLLESEREEEEEAKKKHWTFGGSINKSVRQKGRRETLPDVILQIGFRFRFRSTERGHAPRVWSSFAESTIFLRFTEPENGRTFTAVNPRRIISSKVKRERERIDPIPSFSFLLSSSFNNLSSHGFRD